MTAANEPPVLAGITTTLASQKGTMNALRITRRPDEIDITLEAEVRDLRRHLSDIMASLRACQGVIRVDRVKG